MIDLAESITTERVAVVTMRLARGESATTMQVAEWTGLSRFGAWAMLTKLSRVLPLSCVDGEWRITG